MTNHFNQLTESEAERLAILAEECAEVIQVVGKILRHGYNSANPQNESGPTNRKMLERELGDVERAITMLSQMGDVSLGDIIKHADQKSKLIGRYLHHQ